jgi:hypothetical protein
MEIRRININGYSDVDKLKIYLLEKLKLTDFKRNNLEEFEIRLTDFLLRNKNLQLEFQLDLNLFEKDLRFNISILNNSKSIPENYEFGNQLNRWIFDGVSTTQEYSENKKLELEQQLKYEKDKFNAFFERLESLTNGQIKIEKN